MKTIIFVNGIGWTVLICWIFEAKWQNERAGKWKNPVVKSGKIVSQSKVQSLHFFLGHSFSL